MAIRVSIIEDDARVLETLANLIDGWPALSCVSKHARAADAIAQIPAFKPDVVLVDLELGKNLSGVDCIRQLRQKGLDSAFLAYTVHDDPKWVFPAFMAGASGYLLKGGTPARLLEAIHAVHRRESPMSAGIAQQILKSFRARDKAAQDLAKLTDRQLEVLELAAHGATTQEIAAKLEIAAKTVYCHFDQIYGKLHCSSRAEAASKYLAGSCHLPDKFGDIKRVT